MATIKQSYLNQTYSGSYGGLSGFVKNRTKWKDKDEVAKELRKLRGYALHGDVRYKFPRRKIMVNFINEMWANKFEGAQCGGCQSEQYELSLGGGGCSVQERIHTSTEGQDVYFNDTGF